MRVSNSLYPSEEQLKGFLESGPEGPICMVNPLKFRFLSIVGCWS
jgi:hypothetical protein